ncbi:MAG: hypothetical protein CYG59_00145 [Chloroflexi bacterium]|nr:MAG: hypothetical protein CYG59_00145 [Chloroflexota bacterium]
MSERTFFPETMQLDYRTLESDDPDSIQLIMHSPSLDGTVHISDEGTSHASFALTLVEARQLDDLVRQVVDRIVREAL